MAVNFLVRYSYEFSLLNHESQNEEEHQSILAHFTERLEYFRTLSHLALNRTFSFIFGYDKDRSSSSSHVPSCSNLLTLRLRILLR